MKATGIILSIVAGLALCAGLFFGYWSYRNTGSAERLASNLPEGAGFVVRIVEHKAKKQRDLALMLGGPGLIGLAAGIVLTKKGRRTAAA